MKPQSSTLAAIAYLSAGILAFVLTDTIMKLASTSYPIHQALVIRGLSAVPAALLLVYAGGAAKALKGSTRAIWPRSALITLANITLFLGLATLPLATASALCQTIPLFIVVLSVLLLKERVGYMQWGALLAGFAGAIIIIHPGEGAFEWAMILPLLSALFYAGNVIWVRKTGNQNPTEVIAFQGTLWLSAAGVLLALAFGFGELDWEIQRHPTMDFLLRGWQWPEAYHLAALLVCGVIGAAATLLLTKGYAMSSASLLAPFEYTGLIWSILLGWVIWGHLPSSKDWLGMALLVAAGVVSVSTAESGNTETGEDGEQH